MNWYNHKLTFSNLILILMNRIFISYMFVRPKKWDILNKIIKARIINLYNCICNLKYLRGKKSCLDKKIWKAFILVTLVLKVVEIIKL